MAYVKETAGGVVEPIRYVSYEGEEQLPLIMGLIDQELSEPYSIFTYRYFITLWPQLCFMAFHEDTCVGTIVCKMGQHRNTFRGYIAMLVVIKPFRGRGIATELVTRSIQVMHDWGCEEVTLEAEVTNKGALALYGNLGFTRAKRLYKYYLNGVDAFRLKLLFPRPYDQCSHSECGQQEPHHHHHHHSHNDDHDHSSCHHHHHSHNNNDHDHNHDHTHSDCHHHHHSRIDDHDHSGCDHHHHSRIDDHDHSGCDHHHHSHNDGHDLGGYSGHVHEQRGRFPAYDSYSQHPGHTCAHHEHH